MRLRQICCALVLLCLASMVANAQGGPFHLRVVPQNSSIPLGASRSFFFERFILKHSPSVLVNGAQWTSSNPAVATVNPVTGVVHSISLGSTIIYASSGPYHGSTRVNVGPVSLISIDVTPHNPTITNPGSQQFTATGHYSNTSVADLTSSATWTSSKPAVATIPTSGGLATAVASGTSVISAAFAGLTGKTGLNVGLTGQISVSPASAKISVGQLQPFTALGTFTGIVGSQNITNAVNWSTNSCAFASISNQGVAAGMAAGTCSNITAGSGAVTSNAAQLQVVPRPTLAAIKVAATPLSVSQGASRQFTATGVFTDGSTKSLPNVGWFSANSAVASIDANGLVTAPITGMGVTVVAITAVSGNISGSANLTVNPPPALNTITVTPLNVVLPGGTTQQYTAIGHYSDASTKDLTATATWSSSNTSVAVISPAGLAAAVGPGSTTIKATVGAVNGTANLQSLSVPRFIYVGNQGDNTISAYGINANTGQFVPLGYTFTGAGNAPLSLVADPAGKFLYANRPGGTDDILGYQINPSNGTLTPIPLSTGASGLTQGGPQGMAIHSGFLYFANTGGISGFTINPANGVLTQMSGSPFSPSTSAYAIALDPTGHFAYVASSSGNTISEFNVDQSTGALTAITNFASIACSGSPSSLAVHPTGKFVYCTNSSGNTVTAFSVNASGGLVALGSPVATGSNPQQVSIHPSGTFAYVANAGGTISAYSIDVNGGLHALAANLGNPYTAGNTPSAIGMDPNGRGLAVVNRGSNEVWEFGIDSVTGALTAPNKTRTRLTPAAIAVANGPTLLAEHPNFVYAADLAGQIDAFDIDPITGSLTPALGAPFRDLFTPQSVVTDRLGRFAFATDTTHDKVVTFTIDPSTGMLAPIASPPATAGSFPHKSVVDPSGRFLYTTNEISGNLSAYSIDGTTGALTELTGLGSPYATGACPQGLTIEPSGRFLYVVNCNNAGNSAVKRFSIDPLSGGLSVIAGSLPLYNNPADAVAPPSGRFLYVSNFASNTISLYSIDPVTGALTELTGVGSPYASAGINPWGMSMDPSGIFLYTANYGSGTLSGYAADPNSGALTTLPGSPFSASPNPQSVSVDPSGNFAYVSDRFAGTILGYTLDANGIPTSTGSFSEAPFASEIYWVTATGSLAPPTPRLVFITVSSPLTALAQGQQQQFAATGTFSDGSTQDFTNSAIWTTSDSTIASVSSSGFVLGAAQGDASISASFNGVSGSLPVEVTALSLVSLAVTPASINVPQGNTAQFAALGTFSDGTTQDLSSSVIWTSTSPTVATINASGTATGVSAGSTTITATSGALISPNSTMTVHTVATVSSVTVAPVNPSIPLGTSIQFAATAHYSDATTSDVTSLATWNSASPAVATISNSSGTGGLASSVAGGASAITAAFGGKTSAASTLTVAVHTLVSISVSPSSAFIPLQHTGQFTATGTFSDGATQDLTTSVAWSSSATSIVAITNTGLATGKGLGNATITATQSGVSGTASVSGIF